jgi:hypothetical protein
MTDTPGEDELYEVWVSGALDRHAAEALRLELRRLARQQNIEITVRVEKDPGA